jgi:hypothetical protein
MVDIDAHTKAADIDAHLRRLVVADDLRHEPGDLASCPFLDRSRPS